VIGHDRMVHIMSYCIFDSLNVIVRHVLVVFINCFFFGFLCCHLVLHVLVVFINCFFGFLCCHLVVVYLFASIKYQPGDWSR